VNPDCSCFTCPGGQKPDTAQRNCLS
jgi:hypothetical protein